jgi:hypothetical protein
MVALLFFLGCRASAAAGLGWRASESLGIGAPLMGLEPLALKLAADLAGSLGCLLAVQDLPEQKCGFHAFLYLQAFRCCHQIPGFRAGSLKPGNQKARQLLEKLEYSPAAIFSAGSCLAAAAMAARDP